MGTLSRIAQELNTDLSYLLLQENESANKNPSIVVVKKDASEIGESSSNFHQNIVQGYDFEPLAREKRGKNMQPYILIPDFESAETIHHEAEEFIYILKGKIEFFYGTEKYVLAAGDCAYFDSDTPHSGRSVGKEKAKVLVILYSYKRL
jgi:mannose-6-phosphate isomerase-like protein (cupin superfamily)